VKFKGFLPKTELAEKIPAYDLSIFLLSQAEPFAYAPLEALFAGVPCIIPKNTSTTEIFDSGMDEFLLHDRQDARETADLVKKCLEDRSFLRRMGDKMLASARVAVDLKEVVMPQILDFIGSLPRQAGYDFDRVMEVAHKMRFEQHDSAGRKKQKSKAMMGFVLNFSTSGNSTLFTGEGWSGPEVWGTWTEGEKATLQARFAEVPSGGFKINALLKGHVCRAHPKVFVDVSVNEELVARWVVKKTYLKKFSARVPADKLKSAECRISFDIKNPISPHEMDATSPDYRRLGAGFGRMEFQIGRFQWF
jgi:hypothetical protein